VLTCANGSASVAVMTDPAALPTFGLPPASGPPPPPASPAGSSPAGPAADATTARVPAGTPAVDSAPEGSRTRDDAGQGPGEGSGSLRDRVVAALHGAGHRPAVDEDGDVAVTVQEQRLYVRCVDSVPPLMRVFGQWLMDDVPHDELARLRAANAITASVNLAKATVDEDRLAVAVDLLAGDGFHLPSLLDASLDAVLGCVRSWHATVLQLAVDPTAPPAPVPTRSAPVPTGSARRAPDDHERSVSDGR
jgi:hypothetical protein